MNKNSFFLYYILDANVSTLPLDKIAKCYRYELLNGKIEPTKTIYYPNDVILMRCKFGFYFNNSKQTVISNECLSNGKWMVYQLNCTRIRQTINEEEYSSRCGKIPYLKNYNVLIPSNNYTSVNVHCKNGYTTKNGTLAGIMTCNELTTVWELSLLAKCYRK